MTHHNMIFDTLALNTASWAPTVAALTIENSPTLQLVAVTLSITVSILSILKLFGVDIRIKHKKRGDSNKA